MPRGEEDFLGEGRPHDIDQPFDAGIGIAQAELGRRNAEARIIRTDAQIAADREPETTADAVAADHRDGRLAEIENALIGARHGVVVDLGGVERSTFALKFRNVGAGDERLAACARDHDHAHRLVPGEILEDLGRSRPHLQRHGVVTLRIVEDEVTDAPIRAREHLVGLGHVVHGMSSALMSRLVNSLSHRIGLAQRGDLLRAEAEFLEHRVGVLAEAGRRRH